MWGSVGEGGVVWWSVVQCGGDWRVHHSDMFTGVVVPWISIHCGRLQTPADGEGERGKSKFRKVGGGGIYSRARFFCITCDMEVRSPRPYLS